MMKTIKLCILICAAFKDLQCIDVSTAAGSAAAAAAAGTLTNIGGPGKEFQVWVQDTMTPVQVFGKKPA